MFKHLSDHSLQFLLFLFNDLWVTGVVPKPWLHSIVIPVHKQSKPSNLPSSYRPISLTGNACKIKEKMVVNSVPFKPKKTELSAPFLPAEQNFENRHLHFWTQFPSLEKISQHTI